MHSPRTFSLVAALLLAFTSASAQEPEASPFPDHYAPERAYTGQRMHDLLDVPEHRVDVGLWALVLAKEYDPTVGVPAYLARLGRMAAEVRQMLAGRTADMDKLLAVRAFLYQPGPWNDNQPFTYDLDDPLGERPSAQLLSTYLDTKRGNCVTMPVLFLALLERLDPDLPARGVAVPFHLFVRVHDRQTGDVWNVETTNGGSPARNQYYVEETGISERALAAGTYLRDLTKRELLGELVGTLTMRERAAERYEAALSWAALTLALSPRSVGGLVNRGAVLEWIVYEATDGGPASAEHAPLLAESRAAIEQAFALGWEPETAEDRAAYLQEVEAERERRARSTN